MRRPDGQKTAPKKENNAYTLNSSSTPLLYNIMQSLSAFEQCSLLPRHFNSDSFIQGDCGFCRMSIVSLANTVLVVAAIMPWISVSAADSTVVRDVDGTPLIAGSKYYVQPAISGYGGGLGLTLKSRNGWCPNYFWCPLYAWCPFYVAQGRSEVSKGIPVIFTPSSGLEREIRVGEDLTVTSYASPICPQYYVWRIDSSKDAQRRLVAAGGRPSVFRIEAYGTDYVLVFCEEPCSSCKPICSKLGIHIDSHSNRWLASPSDADIPIFFPFSFKNATVADSDSGSGFQSE